MTDVVITNTTVQNLAQIIIIIENVVILKIVQFAFTSIISTRCKLNSFSWNWRSIWLYMARVV